MYKSELKGNVAQGCYAKGTPVGSCARSASTILAVKGGSTECEPPVGIDGFKIRGWMLKTLRLLWSRPPNCVPISFRHGVGLDAHRRHPLMSSNQVQLAVFFTLVFLQRRVRLFNALLSTASKRAIASFSLYCWSDWPVLPIRARSCR